MEQIQLSLKASIRLIIVIRTKSPKYKASGGAFQEGSRGNSQSGAEVTPRPLQKKPLKVTTRVQKRA